MTRAMICDPQMPALARAGQTDDIRACIGCNQACIGHFHLGFPISCIQHPETGRERLYGIRRRADRPKKVMVVGGGQAGLKAAAIAAERGHDVTLHEAAGGWADRCCWPSGCRDGRSSAARSPTCPARRPGPG